MIPGDKSDFSDFQFNNNIRCIEIEKQQKLDDSYGV